MSARLSNATNFERALAVVARELGTEVNISRLIVLLAIYKEPDIEQFKLGEQTGFPVSTLSRILIDLSGTNRKREPGPDLVEARPDPMWRRRNLINLTERGVKFMESVLDTIKR